MNVGTDAERPECDVQVTDSGLVRVQTRTAGVQAVVEIALTTDRAADTPLLHVRCQPDGSELQTLHIE